MEQSSLLDLQGKFLRPASITMRFANSENNAYQEAADLYNNILTASEQFSHKKANDPDYYFYQFQVNRGDNEEQSIELRLELNRKEVPRLKNRPIIYWEIEPDDIDLIINTLTDRGYKLLVRDKITDNNDTRVAERFIAESPQGNLIAGHTNPPFPFTPSK